MCAIVTYNGFMRSCVCVLQMAITEGATLQIEALSESINNLTVSTNTHTHTHKAAG